MNNGLTEFPLLPYKVIPHMLQYSLPDQPVLITEAQETPYSSWVVPESFVVWFW